MSVQESCIRGCVTPRRHLECDRQDTCRGCLPSKATHERLCFTCHDQLTEVLRHAPGQYALLLASTTPSTEQALTVPTTYRHPGPRMDSSAPDYIGAAHASMTAADVEAVRIACIDTAQHLADLLSQLVDECAADFGARGPAPLLTAAERDDPRRKVWRDANSYRSAGYVYLDDGPPRFDVETACEWLRENQARVESRESVGDDLEELNNVMSQAHSLEPWRDPASRLPGIPCPACHRMALLLHGGSDSVQCDSCHKRFPWARYAIWVQMYQEGV